VKVDEKILEIQNQREEILRLRSLLEKAQDEKASLTQKIDSLSHQLSTRQTNVPTSRPPSPSSPTSGVDLISLQSELMEKNLEIQCYKEVIEQERGNVANYRSISEATIATLEDVKQALSQTKEELKNNQLAFEAKEKRTEETIKTLEERLMLSQEQLDKLNSDRSENVEREHLLQTRINELEQSVLSAEEKYRESRDELKSLNEMYLSAQSKYEQECILRLSDVKTLAEAHAKIEKDKESVVQVKVNFCVGFCIN
jgi:chromosome segregation ATPase